jgi:regulator of protease activity HflC (stomatin/prohibitin superfamily)
MKKIPRGKFDKGKIVRLGPQELSAEEHAEAERQISIADEQAEAERQIAIAEEQSSSAPFSNQ